MKHNVPISHVMTTDVRNAHLGQPLSEVRTMMAEGGFHHVPVVSGKKLVGLVTSTDILRVSYTYGTDARQVDAVLDGTVTLADLMQKYPITLTNRSVVRDAVEIFAQGKFHSLPVVDEDENLLGLVTTTDVMRYFKDQY